MPASPELIAHRAGPVHDEQPRFAEQTLPAFAAMWAAGPLACELDVRCTGDGVPVVFHDADLRRVTGEPGRLCDLGLADFKRLQADVLGADRRLARAAEPVPLATLGEALALAARMRGRLLVELKEAGTAGVVADALLASGVRADRVTVQSFLPDTVAELRHRLPHVPASLLVAPEDLDGAPLRALRHGASAIGLPWPRGAAMVAEAAARGLRVMAWTVNRPDAIRAAAAAGVHAVITDDVASARRALQAPVSTVSSWV